MNFPIQGIRYLTVHNPKQIVQLGLFFRALIVYPLRHPNQGCMFLFHQSSVSVCRSWF